MKRGPFLLDTGFLVALVNAADPAHVACSETWAELRGPFVSTEGVLVEAAWLLRRDPAAFERLADITLRVGTLVMAPLPLRTRRALELMSEYRDIPMDLVDALLVAISEETGVLQVLTLDRRGFGAFCTRAGKKLSVLP